MSSEAGEQAVRLNFIEKLLLWGAERTHSEKETEVLRELHWTCIYAYPLPKVSSLNRWGRQSESEPGIFKTDLRDLEQNIKDCNTFVS